MQVSIDNIDKRILFELEKNARISDVALAKIVGKSKDAVRYRIKNLEEKGIIEGYGTWIDFAKLGYGVSTIYLTIMNLPHKKERLIEEIKKDKRVYWMGVAEGVWNIGISYFVKSNEELFQIKNDLLSKYEDLIIDSKIASLISVSIHEKIFLFKGDSSFLTFTEGAGKYTLDKMGENVLRELYANSRENIASIAHKYKTSVDIIRNRMKSLENEKIIIRYTINLNYQKIGYEFYKAFVYLKSPNPENIAKVLKYAEKSDKIINIVKQVAPWDFEFVIFAEGFNDYSSVISRFTERFSDSIRKIETSSMSKDVIFPSDTLIFD